MEVNNNASTPNNLFSQPLLFVNRLHEFDRAERMLADSGISIISISGPAGIGKTAFANMFAKRQIEHKLFPGGVVWLDCNITSSFHTVLATIASVKSIEFSPISPTELRNKVIQHLNSAQTLLIFDNYETVIEDDEILSFIGHLPKPTKALILTRKGLRIPKESSSIRLAPLDENVAFELWKQYLGAENWNEIDKETLVDINHWTGGLPLAIRFVGNQINQGWSLQDILDQLKKGTTPGVTVVERILEQVETDLTKEQHQFLDTLSIFTHPVDGVTIAKIAEIEDWRRPAEILVRKAIIDSTDGWYVLHPLVQVYIQRHIEPSRLEAIQRRMIQYYYAYIEKFEHDFDQIDHEWPNIQNAVDIAYTNHYWEIFIKFILTLGQFLNARGYENNQQKWLNQAIDVSDKIDSTSLRAALLHELGVRFQQRGEFDTAVELYKQSLMLEESSDDLSGKSATLTNIGYVYRSRGDYRNSINYYELALKISRQLGDREREANVIWSLGGSYAEMGELGRAIEYYQQALAISREIEDRLGESNALGNLGAAYSNLGEPRRAIDYYQQALAICREIGDRRAEASFLRNLGAAYLNLGEPRRAIDNYQLALAIGREIGDRRADANSLGNLGSAYSNLGEQSQAINYHQQALSTSREIGDRLGAANSLANLGITYSNLGEYSKAIDYYQQALSISREIGDQKRIAGLYANLGVTFSNLYTVTGDSSDIQSALDFNNKAKETFRPEANPSEYAMLQNNIANIYASLRTGDKAENIEQAIAHYEDALKFRSIESYPLDWAATQKNLALAFIHRSRGDHAENLKHAIVCYEQALRIYTKENSPYDWLLVSTNLSTAYAEIGKWPESKAQATAILLSFQNTILEVEYLKSLLSWYQRLGELAIQNQDLEFATCVFADVAHRFELQDSEVPDSIRIKLVELREQLGYDRFVIIYAEAQGLLRSDFAQSLKEARQLMSQEQFREAADSLSNALSLLLAMKATENWKRQRATVLFLRGFCLRKQELWENALQDQNDSFLLFDQLHDFEGEAHTFLEIGHLYEVMNNYEDARLHYMDAYRLYRRAEDKLGMASASENLGRLEYRVRMFSQSVQDLEEARSLYILMGDRTKAAIIESDLDSARASLSYQSSNEDKRSKSK